MSEAEWVDLFNAADKLVFEKGFIGVKVLLWGGLEFRRWIC